jgi:uncharacterized protein YdhG (YjbR/CyaY superfamily)
MTGAHDVDAYLAALPDDARAALSDLRARIRAIAPNASERVSYKVPAFFHDGALVSYNARPTFCSFYVQSPELVRALADELAGLDVRGSTIRFSPERPLPDRVVELVVRGRLEENADRSRQ